MKHDVLVVVHCYAGDASQVEAFLPEYLHHGSSVLVLSPTDSPVRIYHPDVTCGVGGLVGWKGTHTVQRQVIHWTGAAKYPHDWYLLHDSDSVCLSRDLPEYLFEDPEVFWANVIGVDRSLVGTPADVGVNFQPPYFFSRSTLHQLIQQAEVLEIPPGSAIVEPHDWNNAIDGFYVQLVRNLLRLPYKTYPDGATTWPPDTQDLARDVASGARFLHGVKDRETLDHLLTLWNERNET